MPKIVNHSERRELILDSSLQLFLSRGFRRTSMGDIALDCKLSRTSLYQYFANKEAILFTLMLNNLNNLKKVLAEKVEKEERTLDAGQSVIKALVDDIEKNHGLYVIVYEHYYAKRNADFTEELNESYEAFGELLEAVMQKDSGNIENITRQKEILRGYLLFRIVRLLFLSVDQIRKEKKRILSSLNDYLAQVN